MSLTDDKKLSQIFFEIHRDNAREGPGDFESTRRAFNSLEDLPSAPTILDVGCGPGQQTLDLAQLSQGRIYAMDFYELYLSQVKSRSDSLNLTDRISLVRGDMNLLAFQSEVFDVIWAEGSIYLMGFEKGLIEWRPHLKERGYLVVSEATWLKKDPPAELRAFWHEGYPAMTTISSNLTIIQSCGYRLVDYFILPESAWWEGYYHAIQNKIDKLRQTYSNDPEVLDLLRSEEVEMELYRRYSSYFGYVFYTMQKN